MGAAEFAWACALSALRAARKLVRSTQVAATSRESQGTPLLVLPRTPTPAVDPFSSKFSPKRVLPRSLAKRSRSSAATLTSNAVELSPQSCSTCPPAPPCKTTTTIWSPALRRYARRHTARAQHAIKGCGSRAETPMLLALALDCSSHRALASLASSSQLREKREELNRSIAADEEEKGASSPSPHRRCAQSLLASFVSMP